MNLLRKLVSLYNIHTRGIYGRATARIENDLSFIDESMNGIIYCYHNNYMPCVVRDSR